MRKTTVLCALLLGAFGCDGDSDDVGAGGMGGNVAIDMGMGAGGMGAGGMGAGGMGAGGMGAGGMGAGGMGGMPPGPPFGSEEDIATATALWTEIADREQWGYFPGKVGVVDADQPHTDYAIIRVNEAFGDDGSADGTIIVKDNVTDNRGENLMAVTVMKKIDGFNGDEADWFWAKFMPDGTIAQNPAGISMVGKVGKGGAMGCIPCHSNAAGGDFLYSNDEPAGPPFGSSVDIELAEELWGMIGDRDQWGYFPGKDGVIESMMPHADFASIKVNGEFANGIGAGTIVVKDNLADAAGENLMAVTAMWKLDGYNGEEADWFWAKFMPDGTIAQNPGGVSLVGRVGKGGAMGCIPCHAGSAGGDFLFSND